MKAQNDSINPYFKNGIDQPSILPLHPFGIFNSRINPNFKNTTPKALTFNISYESANVFQPEVIAYYALNTDTQEKLQNYKSSIRRFYELQNNHSTNDYETSEVFMDAVIKNFRVDLNLKLAQNHELGISFRGFLTSNGKYPTTIITNDEFIEWFHDQIRDSDPFGRRYHGLSEFHFKYKDTNGNTLTLESNEFIFSGIELNYFYYPKFLKNPSKGISTNIGVHNGFNTSKQNRSYDLGISSNFIKSYKLKHNNEFTIGLGANALRKNLIDINKNVTLGENDFLIGLTSSFEYAIFNKKSNYHGFNLSIQYQSPYNKRKDSDYLAINATSANRYPHWKNGIATLHEDLIYWSIMYSYATTKFKASIYLLEDLIINNAPDSQIGFSLKMPLFNK